MNNLLIKWFNEWEYSYISDRSIYYDLAYGKIDGDTRIIRYKKFSECSYQEKSYI